MFPDFVIIGCDFHFNHCLWRQSEVWNINKHRNWTKNAVEVWNSKLNSVIGKQRNVILLGQKLKEETERVTWQLKSKELGKPGQKRNTYVKQSERIKIIMEE